MTGQRWLLDTNVLLAALIKPELLPTDTQMLLQDPGSAVYFSAASLWEIAIKHSLGRDDFDFLPEDIHQLALQTGFTELPVAASHSYAIARIAWHHRDPFDRLLVAQAQSLQAYLLTSDGMLEQYSGLVKRIAIKPG